MLRSMRLPRRVPYTHVALAFIFGCIAIAAYLTFEQANTAPANVDVVRTSFSMCSRPPHSNCVIDGDTFYLGARSIRIADIDAPETHPSRCAYEADLGGRATRRLLALLNQGPFTLQSWPSRDKDQYGRELRVVMRDGRSLGAILVSEGLARTWTGRRMPWCS